jgi:hypothetical protein
MVAVQIEQPTRVARRNPLATQHVVFRRRHHVRDFLVVSAHIRGGDVARHFQHARTVRTKDLTGFQNL